MKRIFVSVLSAAFSVSAFALGPRIDPASVKLEQKFGAKAATIEYVLENSPGIVTVDIETNAVANAAKDDPGWVSIGGENIQGLEGDVNKLVEETGRRTITWNLFEGWPGQKVPKGSARAVVTAWATNAPPDYLVVDLAQDNHIRYYTSTNFLPYGGLTNVYYKRDAIVMRKIPAQAVEWKMGSAAGSTFHYGNEPQHDVILTNDFYIGVFMLTRGQVVKFASYDWNTKDPYCMIDGQKAWQYGKIRCDGGGDPTNAAPCCTTNWKFMRGEAADGYDWPANRHKVNPERWLGRARAKTGVDFDLPTEAQWEFACRAGTSTDTYNGDFKKTNDDIEKVVKPIAWFDGSLGGMQWSPVGEKIPNAFGLYDMIGNGCELCLDYYAADYGGVAKKYEPEGPASGSARTYRSCSGALSYLYATSAKRDNQNRTYYGTRLVCPIMLKYAEQEKE